MLNSVNKNHPERHSALIALELSCLDIDNTALSEVCLPDFRCLHEHGISHHVQCPLRSADGQQLLTDKTSILAHWSEHYQNLFSADRMLHDSAILQVPQQPVKSELYWLPIIEETTKGIQQLESCKAVGM